MTDTSASMRYVRPGAMRWTPERKREIVEAVIVREESTAMLCAKNGISPDELASWIARCALYGKAGLRTVKLQQYSGRKYSGPGKKPILSSRASYRRAGV